MNEQPQELIQYYHDLALDNGTMMLSFDGWMDGGDVSTGTVERLVDLLDAEPVAEIDSEPFYIYNFPGSMEVATLFRPHIEVEDGLVKSVELPSNVMYCHEAENLVLFVGKEPNLRWRTYSNVLFSYAHSVGVKRLLFVGSFGGAVPHTREPRLYITCSDPSLLPEMEPYGLRRSGYEGPGSFTSYLLTRAADAGLDMISLVAEIPGYLQGTNPASIEAVTRRLSKILQLPLDLDSLRATSTEWELEISTAVEQNEKLAAKVRKLEEAYDDDLLKRHETG